MPSVFDPQTFAQMTFTEQNSTESFPVPVGDWPFQITKAEITAWTKKDNPNEGGLKCTLMLATEDPAVQAVTGRPKNVLRHEMMLDLTPEGGLDFGKGMNVQLGRAREACGLNKPGQAFAFDMFVGHDVIGSVKHEIYQDRQMARVAAIAHA